MSDIVFILGAGASRQAGGPLMSDFLDVASDLLRSNQVNTKREEFNRVFAAIGGLQAVHSKAQLDLNNIESIFTALELGRVIQRVPGMEAGEIPEAIASLKELIVTTLDTTIRFPCERRYIKAPEPYSKFAGLLNYLRTDASPTKSTSIITFNYDIAADVALYREGLGPNYVIEAPPTQGESVDLLKLHGSLNWAAEKSTKRLRALHPFHYFQTYSVNGFEEHSRIRLPLGEHLSEYFCKHAAPTVEVEREPVIVPPTWNKADYHHALSAVWCRAAQHLSEAESIFIIGYSLPETDSFFRQLYALGSVGSATLRRIVVFNPDSSGQTDTRFREMLGPGSIARYEYRPETFEQAIASIKGYFPPRR